MSEYEADKDDMTGYISVKDYAYDESNPLHFGYFEEEDKEEEEVEEGSANVRISNTKSILLPDEYVVNRKAVAIYPFVPENDNELELNEGDIVYISYKHGQGWLVAENRDRTRTGLVPEEYVSLLEEESDEENENPRPFYLTQMLTQNIEKSVSLDDDDWEDVEGDSEDEDSNDYFSPTNNENETIGHSSVELERNLQNGGLFASDNSERSFILHEKGVTDGNEELHNLQRRLQENLEI